MTLPTHLQDYKIPHVANGSRKFFNDYPIKDWSFDNYYRSTHHNLNKEKKFSVDIKLFKKSLQALPENSEEQEEDFGFLQEIFRGFSRSYSVVQNIYDGEATFNSLLIYPFLEAVANGVTVNRCGAELKVGEPVLKSMSKQLKELGLQVDDKSQYKADGIIKLFKMKEIEVLFLETSGSFGNKDKVKINFDHHKGTQEEL